ncbi:MAG: hypothetical protein M1817_006005 [Caeruleum heppii]|nr:MAG: hypothetical protein M1817_006005 [Caeruleum heppii]
MQGSRSLFQAGIKLGQNVKPNPSPAPGAISPNATGIHKSRPFLNVWRGSDDTGSKRLHTGTSMAKATEIWDFKPLDDQGKPFPLSAHKGKVLLLINVASKCGFTPQYTALEALNQRLSTAYPDQFQILAFPCNQFGNQEPGSAAEIQDFCTRTYGVNFPVLGKVEVNGDQADPVWDWLKAEKPGVMGLKRIKWNFEKFLVGRDGKVKQRWASTTKPEALEGPIVEEIKKGLAEGSAKAEL